MKVIHHLGKGNYLETIRGKNGGFRLARDPKEINIGELIRYTEDDLALINLKEMNADINEKVNFNIIVDKALGAFMATLDHYTLADLVDDQTFMNF